MAPAPVTPSPENVSGFALLFDWARDWWMTLFGGGFLVWFMRAAAWKRSVEMTQVDHGRRLDDLETADDARVASHGARIAALETADDVRGASHTKLAVDVAALPRREEVREMIAELREDIRSLQASGGRG